MFYKKEIKLAYDQFIPTYGLTFITAWINNHMHTKVWNEITYSFPNFKGSTVEVWE